MEMSTASCYIHPVFPVAYSLNNSAKCLTFARRAIWQHQINISSGNNCQINLHQTAHLNEAGHCPPISYSTGDLPAWVISNRVVLPLPAPFFPAEGWRPSNLDLLHHNNQEKSHENTSLIHSHLHLFLHSRIEVENKLLGDPIEVAALRSIAA